MTGIVQNVFQQWEFMFFLTQYSIWPLWVMYDGLSGHKHILHKGIIYKAMLWLSGVQRTALLQIFGRYGLKGARWEEEGREGDGSERGRQAGGHWDDGGSVGERAVTCSPDARRTRAGRDVEEDGRGVCGVGGHIWGQETPGGPQTGFQDVFRRIWGCEKISRGTASEPLS